MEDAWPEHLLASNHPVRQWNRRSDTTWDTIRQDYLAGIPARDLCDRYEVALSTLRLKAKEGGWRRADQADSDLFPADADRWARDDPDDDAGDDAADSGSVAEEESWVYLADRARFRLRRAIASGRAAEAASWLRVHQRLRALADAEAVLIDTPPELALQPEPQSEPQPAPQPDPIHAAMSLAAKVGSLARSAARATTEAEFEAIDTEVEALKALAAALSGGSDESEDDPTLDSLDSLDPVFSEPAEAVRAPDRQTLLRMRERRLGLGLGVADLDQRLAELDRAWTGPELSP